MKYSTEKLFEYHEKEVRATCKDGKVFEGMVWAYSEITNEEEYGVPEPSLEFMGTTVYASEIEKIELI